MGLEDIPQVNPEKFLKKYEGKTEYKFEVKSTHDEKKFIEKYLECGNASASVVYVWPDMAKNPQSARNKGSILVRKFGLKGKNLETVKLQNRHRNDNAENAVEVIKRKYKQGLIDEEELYRRMDNLSKRSTSDQARFTATREMYAWLKEAKKEVEASRLSQLDIITLMVDSLSALPREKYKSVLRETRKKRQQVIKERIIVYDPDEIRQAERAKMIDGGDKWQTDQVI